MNYYHSNHENYMTQHHAKFFYHKIIDPSKYFIQRDATRANIVDSKINMNIMPSANILLNDQQNIIYNQNYISSNLLNRQEKSDNYSIIYKTSEKIRRTKSKINKFNQKLFIIRHGERVDTTFGTLWLKNSFKNGDYIRFNLNMPKTIPYRGDVNEFAFDPPLTEVGMFQAKLHGEEFTRRRIKVTHVYSSPALRSIQTADKIIEGMGLKNILPIRIEAGLFELLSWQNFIPKKYPFMSTTMLIKNGYNIDADYMSLFPYYTLKTDETEEEFYNRSHSLTTNILKRHALEGGNIIFVGHAPTIEGCSRQLVGRKLRPVEEFVRINMKVPFLSILECEKNINGSWSIVPPTLPTMKHTNVIDFNWIDVKGQNN